MNFSSFKSFTSLLLFGALAIGQLAGCAEPGEADDAGVASTSSALTRATTIDSTDTPTTSKTTTTTSKTTATIDLGTAKTNVATVVTTTITPAAPPPGTDYERNHPWAVTIDGTGGLNCRGTLIHPQWVLTAGHCMGPYAGTVHYTRTDASGAPVTDSRRFDELGPSRGMFRPSTYQADTNFGQPKDDIMLIRLASPFTIDANIQTAALPRFYANPGRTGTIATNNHSSAPAGYVSIVRTQQLPTANCDAPAGFVCISPPAGSLCKGDSGSGFVEILDGRAQLVGITSNIDVSSSSDDCIAASRQAELTDVYAYRDWIYGTMGMNPEQTDGRVRLRWSGVASQPGIMSLQCLSATVPTVQVAMNVPGSEISMDNCDDVRVFCQTQGSNLNLSSFTMRTIASNGALIATQSLPFLPTFTAAAGDPTGSSSLAFNCGVYDLTNPVATNSSGSVLATAN